MRNDKHQKSKPYRSSNVIVSFQSRVLFVLALLLACVPWAQGQTPAAGFVQGNYSDPPQSQNGMSATYTQSQSAGDLNLVVLCWSDVDATVQSVTDSAGNTYAVAAGPTVVSGSITQAVYYAKNIHAAAANANTVTVQLSAVVDLPDVRIAEYSGIDPTTPIDTVVAVSGIGATMDSGPLATMHASDLLVVAAGTRDYVGSPDPNYVNRMTTSEGDILEDTLVSVLGSYRAITEQDGSDPWIMQLVALRFAPNVFSGAVQTNYEVFQSSTRNAWAGFNGPQTAGNMNVAIVSWRNSGAQVGEILDSMGNTYALAAGPVQTGSLSQAIYYAKNIVSALPRQNVIGVNLTDFATDIEVQVAEYSGLDTVNPLDVAVGAQGSGSTSDSGLVQTTNWNDLLVGANTVNTANTSAAGSGFLERFVTSPLGDILEDAEASSVGSYHATAPLSSSANWIMQMVAFGTAAGSGGSSAPFISSLSPNIGPVGSAVTIAGGNFGSIQGASTVSFNGTVASVSSWSSTSITANVPQGATSGNVVVTVGSQWSNGVRFNLPQPSATYIQGNSADPAGPQTAVSVAYTAPQSQADLNVVAVGWQGDSITVSSVTDSKGNTYTLALTTLLSGLGGQAIYYAPNISSAGANQNQVTVTFSQPAANPDVRIAEYKGLDSQHPVDVVAGGTGSNGDATTATVTTTNAYDLLFGAIYSEGSSYGAPPYRVRVTSNPNGNLIEDVSVSITGNYYAESGLCPPGPWIMQMVAFRMAAPTTPQNQPPVVNAGPNQTITLPTNTVTLDGSATDDGLPNNTLTVSWSKVSGPGTVTFSSPNTATTQATFSTSGVYVLQLTANDTQLSSSSNVTITVNPQPFTIVLSPSIAGPDVPGASQTMTATVTSGSSPISGASVQFAVTGANATSGNTTTNSSGVATFSYTGANSGTDTVQAAYSGSNSNTASVSWVTPLQPVSTTTIFGRFFFPATTCGNWCDSLTLTPNSTPVFTQAFPNIDFDPVAGTIPGNTSGVNDNTRPFTDVTTDLNGNFTGTIVAQGNGYQAGTGALFQFQAEFTGSFIAARAGNVSVSFFSDDGVIFGVGGGATYVSGPLVNAPASGKTIFEGFPLMMSYNNGTDPPLATTVVFNVPGPGTYPYEIDYFECCSGTVGLNMTISQSTTYGLPPIGQLTITPSTPASIQIGQTETLTVKAIEGSGAPIANLNVGLQINGANTRQLSGITNSAGQATFSYAGANGGSDLVQAIADITGMGTYSNSVTVPWTVPSGTQSCDLFTFTPQGWIGSPLIGATVQGQVPITLASGITLTSGTLKMFPSANPNQVTVLNSSTTGTGPRTLGTIDATLLANGEYTIQLQATQSSGACQLNEIVVSATGQYKPGRKAVTVTDFKVPLAGIPINITRTYDSLNRATVGDFGNGWNLSTNVQLSVDRLMNVTFTLNGQAQTFYFAPQSSGNFLFPWLIIPAYTPQPGLHGSLTSNGCSALVQVGGALVQDAAGVACFPGGTYQPTIYTYTDPSGRVYTMSSSGQLQSIKDLNGNTLTFSSSGITSSVGGVVIPFVRDSQNRITQITDLDGNNYSYSYDGNGNLQSVQFPGLTTTANYTYATDHSLLTQGDPVGNTSIATYDASGRLQTFTDAAQNKWSYSYNVSTNTTTTTNPDNGTVVETDDAFGKPLSITDPLTRTTTYTYDSNENMISKTDPLTKTTTYTYDANGNQTSVSDPLLHKSTKTYNQFGGVLTATDAATTNTQTATYDANFNLIQVTDLLNGPGTQVFSATYDSLGNALTTTDANQKTTQYSYDPRGNLIQVTDPLSEITRNTYDAMDRLTQQTDPRGNRTQYTYDALGNLKTKTDARENVTSYTYDNNGNRLTETDGNSHTTSYQYDALNRITKITYPDNHTKQYTYDFRGNKLTETDQSGRVTKYTYDLAGELSTVTHAFGTADAGTVTYTYDSDSRVKTVKDELGNTTTSTYDPAGRRTAVQDATTNPPTNYVYDADNRITSVQDPNGNTISYAYYPRNWVKTITYPATSNQPATTKQFTYDGMGRTVQTTDQAGNTVTDTYDGMGRLISVQDALQKLTQYNYDPAGNLTKITNANNNATVFQYDSLNRKSLRGLPKGMVETFSYDGVGNLSVHTDFNGKATTFTYDPLNRLLLKTPDPTLSQPTISFAYNPTGTRQTMTDATGTTTYTYDNRDRLKSKATPEGTLNYTYDAHGNVLTIASSNANGASATYAYDVLNRLSTATDNRLAAQGIASPNTTYSYDPAGNLSGYTYSANGLQSVFAYDTLNRLNQLAWKKSGTSLSSFTYAPFPAGNVHTVAELSGRNVTYGYDNNYRLQSETISSDPAGNNGTEGYTYDNVGNRLTLNSTIPSLSGAVSYAYDSNDRLSTDTYDNNGNTSSSSGISYTYDFENRLLMKGAIVMVYDGDGNRVSETVGSTTTKYLVDDKNPTGYSQVLDEIVNGSVTRTYTYGQQLISENQLIGGTWTPSFYGYDGHGNTRFLVNAAGAVTDTYTFDAFGAQIASTGTTPNPYLYSSERFDSALNLDHLRARYYNTLTGRFETMDPDEGDIFDAVTLHKYLYAGDDPVNKFDPTGREIAERSLLLKIRETASRAVYSAGWRVRALWSAGLCTTAFAADCVLCTYAFQGASRADCLTRAYTVYRQCVALSGMLVPPYWF